MRHQEWYVEPKDVASSYGEHQLGRLLYSVAWNTTPKSIVEFGVLEGYSLIAFAQYQRDIQRVPKTSTPNVVGYDLWEDYPFKHSTMETVSLNLEREVPGAEVRLEKGSVEDWFLQGKDFTTTNHQRLFHLDISNDGEKLTRVLAAARYRQKVFGDLLWSWMLVEGGSHKRDQVEWMVKFEKPSLCRCLNDELPRSSWVLATEEFPSVTLIRFNQKFFARHT